MKYSKIFLLILVILTISIHYVISTISPTEIPTDIPTQIPSEEPSFSPTLIPTEEPSFNPTFVPTSIPSELPSVKPTVDPTFLPSANPSFQPTNKPSSSPTLIPTDEPSFDPTSAPSSLPTDEPSFDPTSAPSSLPTDEPSFDPTSAPSSLPTDEPSFDPTSAPSSLPTDEPSFDPTSAPSSLPTTAESERKISCGQCESNINGACSFYSKNILLLCNKNSTCLYKVTSLSIASDVTINFNLSKCEFKVIATKTFSIGSQSSIMTNSINISASKNIIIEGTLSTSGRGSLFGPGVAIAEGYGGSYGGSGGINLLECNDLLPYSITPHQIGTMNIYGGSNDQSPSGSGGGFNGAGYGGGSISITSITGSINITKSGKVLAEGSMATITTLGAGSGGSILCTALSNVYIDGLLSVQGGRASFSSTNPGAAGGGGRIVIAGIFNSTLIDSKLIIYKGGQIDSLYQSNCLIGGIGTLLLNNTQSGISTLYIDNEYSNTLAGTFIENLPLTLNSVNANHNANLLLATSSISSSNLVLNDSMLYVTHTFDIVVNNTHSVDISNSFGLIDIKNSILLYATGVIPVLLCKILLVDSKSSIHYPLTLVINPTISAKLYGPIIQDLESNSIDSKLTINTLGKGNVTLTYISSVNLYVTAVNIFIESYALISPPNYSFGSCYNESYPQTFKCQNDTVTGSVVSNNTIVFVATNDITFNTNAFVSSSTIFICTPFLTIGLNATLTTSGRGCASNNGIGKGTSLGTDSGGGGGGSFSRGGNGAYNGIDPSYGGTGYLTTSAWYSGSGGGSNYELAAGDFAGAGGGMMILHIYNVFSLSGTISSSGVKGSSSTSTFGGGGGGAGGLIVLSSIEVNGYGDIEVNGGDGCDGYLNFNAVTGGGGGGSGGVLQVVDKNSEEEETNPGGAFGYTFKGKVYTHGGYNGIQAVTCTLLKASNGNIGNIDFPICGSGYGNSNRTCNSDVMGILCDLSICTLCPCDLEKPCTNPNSNDDSTVCTDITCTYNTGNNADSCNLCPYLGSEEQYNSEKLNDDTYYCPQGSSGGCRHCPIICNTNYISCPGFGCLTYLQCFINNYIYFVAPTLFGLIIFVFYVLYSRDKIYIGLIIIKSKIFGIDNKDLFIESFQERTISQNSSEKIELTSNPLQNSIEKSFFERKMQRKRIINESKYFKDRQSGLKLNEDDLPFHACRIYLNGSNHPFTSLGGVWKLSRSRPIALRPMLLPLEYEEFVNKINDLVSWNNSWWVKFCLFVLIIICPPLGQPILKILRENRIVKLINFISSYDHSCFRCSKQRELKDSIRVAVSPDYTLAYIDILFADVDDDDYLPLVGSGQPKLPASFKFAGHGTYQYPWFVDTNDLLLQAIPHTDASSFFIDEAWISFVVDLNKYLRVMQRDFLEDDIIKILQFLQDPITSKSLGGLVFDVCTFSNCENIYQSDKNWKLNLFKGQSTIIDVKNISVDNAEDRESNLLLDNDRFTHRISQQDNPTSLDFANILSPLADYNKNKSNKKSIETITTKESFEHTNKESFDHDQSFNSMKRLKTDKNNEQEKTNKFSHCLHILEAIGDKIVKLKSVVNPGSGFTEEDPNGYDLTFTEMCKAILEGNLCLGVRISHKKVDNFNFQFEDHDINCDNIDLVKKDIDSLNKVLFKTTDSEKKDLIDIEKNLIEDEDEDVSKNYYGNRANEMIKFVNIMNAAEENLSSNYNNENNDEKLLENYKPPSDAKKNCSQLASFDVRSDDSRSDDNDDDEFNQKNDVTPIENKKENIISSLLQHYKATDISNISNNNNNNNNNKSNFSSLRPLLKKCRLIENLAPSAYQHHINIWKLDYDLTSAVSCRVTTYSKQFVTNKTTINQVNLKEEFDNMINNENRQINTPVLSNNVYRIGNDNSKIFNYLLYNNSSNWFLIKEFVRNFYDAIRRILFGSNVHARGPRFTRLVLSVFLFFCQIVDLSTVLIISFVIGINTTTSVGNSFVKLNENQWLYVLFFLPPLAIVLPPFVGAYCILFDRSSAELCRVYANWSRLSLIPVATVLFFTINVNKHSNTTYFPYLTGTLIACKVGQNFFVDHYIAHTESKRISRGWDGLHTSLYPTRDVKMQVTVSKWRKE